MSEPQHDALYEFLERPAGERAQAAKRLLESLDEPDNDPEAAKAARERVLARLRTLRP